MPIEGLTQQQSDFIERFLKVPRIGRRKKMKEKRKEAAEQFRLFNAAHDLLRDEIMAVADPAMRSMLLGQLAVAETIIEKDPDALDFAGGHQQLDDVQEAMLRYMRKKSAEDAHGKLAADIAALEKDNPQALRATGPDAQSDIQLTWSYIEEKFAAGMVKDDPKLLEDALKAMGRLDAMVRAAEKSGKNPFEARIAEVGDAKAAAEASLDPAAQDARRRLLDTFNQLEALRGKLAGQFGEGTVPLALRIGCTTIQKKLDAALNAAPGKLADIADDVEAGLAQVQREAERLIAGAQSWARDHEAFLVRYAVMQSHPKRGDARFVKPEFDKITEAYTAAKAKAASHDYLEASQDLSVVRNDLKDALDFADDCASYDAVRAERRALLQTLPARVPLEKLRDDCIAARKLLTDAESARSEKRVSAAMTLLNQIPGAVAEILDLTRMAQEYNRDKRRWERRQTELNDNYDPEVKALVSDDVAYCQRAGEAAQADAERGAYRSAAGQMRKLCGYQRKVVADAEFAKMYIVERIAFQGRLKALDDLTAEKGRVAIESYLQGLKGDEAKRASAEASGDLKLAKAMCLRLQPQHSGMLRLARDAENYLSRKAEFDAELEKLKGKKSAEAIEARETANEMLANAVAATTRGNWLAGTNLLENATLEIKRAVSDAETAALIDGMQSGEDGVVLTTGSEFKDIYAEFRQVYDHVAGLDTSGAFSEALEAEDTLAKSAEALMPGDLPKAQAAVNKAIEDCKQLAFRITAAASYEAQREATERLTAQAKSANADKTIDVDIAAAEKGLEDAADAAAAPTLDFAGAIKRLADAQAKARLGLDAMALYTKSIKDARAKLEAQIAKFSEAAVKTHLAPMAERLKDVLGRMNTAFDDRDLPGAEAEARKGIELHASYEETFKDYEKAEELIGTYVRGKTGIEMTHPTTTDEAAEITRLTAVMEDAYAKVNFGAAYHTGIQVYRLMHGARRKAQSFDGYLPLKLSCERRLDALEPRAVPEAGPGKDDVDALRKTFDAALAKADLENYGGARKTLVGFRAACTVAGAKIDLYDRYALLKTRAQAALDRVRQNRTEAIEPLLARLEGKDANAQRKAAAYDFAIAIELYTQLIDDCAGAEASAKKIADFADVAADMKVIEDDDLDDLMSAIGKVDKMLTDLMKEPSALYVHGEFMAARARLDTAHNVASENFAAAKQEVEGAADACSEITLLMAQYDQLNDSAEFARTLGASLRDSHPLRQIADHKTYALTDITDRLAALDVSMNAARASRSNRAQTQADIEECITALRDIRRVLDAHLDYVRERVPVAEALEDLEKGDQRHLVREEITLARRALDTAATRAADRNHKSALTEVKAAQVQLDMAALKVKLAANTAPSPADLKTILDAPDGIEKLDGIIEGLEASVQRKVMAAAFESRFGCKLQLNKTGGTEKDGVAMQESDMDLPAPNIRKFYETMSKLPPSDTLENDSMLTFMHLDGKAAGSSYAGGLKKIAMREGDDKTSRIYSIAIEHEVGQLSERALPKDGEERTAFSWNTLHEVGHAVDDKLGFMKKHGERLAGWKVYGADVAEPARAIADKFGFDADYVAEYMLNAQGRDLPIPDPANCDAEEWRRRMEECRIFVDRARVGNKPWSSASIAAACAIGKHTYVESYEGNWARYLTEQRQYAVSGYQFRAPGEWFSELYAAFHSGRLNDNHPHKDEIMDL